MSTGVCPYCERRCRLAEGQMGFCQMYTWADGQVVEHFPHRYSDGSACAACGREWSG